MNPSESPAPSASLNWRHGLRSLRHRNFRLFFTGQSISLIGTWMQQIALGWLVYRLTGSAFMLGLIGFCGQIPSLFVPPLAGALADRLNRHHILIWTQALSMIQALIIAALVLTGVVHVWQLIPLSFFLGCVNGFDIPARQSLYVDLIGNREDLSNAIALNSSMVNGARLIGPTIAGLLIASVGEGVCFLINGISYVAVLWALLAMNPTLREQAPGRGESVLEGMRAGFRYAWGFEPIRVLLLLLALVSVVGMPYSVLMPIFAKQILGGGPSTLGLLVTASGVGALGGALLLAFRRSVLGLGKLIAFAAGLFGLGLIAFSLSRSLWLSMVFLVLSGFGMIVELAASNVVLQTIVDDDKRGRVMSFYTMAFMGMTPFGSLLAGTLASQIGAPMTLLLGGVACIAGALTFASRLSSLRLHVRPIYVARGILPGPAVPDRETSS